MAKKFEFSWPYAAYMDISLLRESKTKKELMAEYKAMRAEGQRRIKQLEKYKWTQASKTYQYNKDRFNRGISRLTKADLVKEMREAAIFLTAQTSTVKGMRQNRDRLLDTFREEWGLEFLNRRNIIPFTKYLEAWREEYGAGFYSMAELEATFRTAVKNKLDFSNVRKNFDQFVEDVKRSDNYEKYYQEAQGFSSDEFDD